MALFEGQQRNFLWGLGIGLAAAILGREILPGFKGAGRPLAKATVKSGILLYEKGRETAARWNEVFEDLVVEAKAELEEEARAKGASPASIPPPIPTEGKVN